MRARTDFRCCKSATKALEIGVIQRYSCLACEWGGISAAVGTFANIRVSDFNQSEGDRLDLSHLRDLNGQVLDFADVMRAMTSRRRACGLTSRNSEMSAARRSPGRSWSRPCHSRATSASECSCSKTGSIGVRPCRRTGCCSLIGRPPIPIRSPCAAASGAG